MAFSIHRKDKRALGELISAIENEDARAFSILDQIYKKTGRALRIGITGFPGAGKSTLVNRLIQEILKTGKSVAAVLVDPTSPFTGGAILGDRVRLRDQKVSDRVFVRSMATRGRLGGLSAMTHAVCDVLDAAGFDFILIETVGVGQLEVDIASTADLVCVVLMPQIGDEIQAMKAGLLEIADFFVVNKMDLDPKREQFMMLKKAFQEAAAGYRGQTVPLLGACAQSGVGVTDIFKTMTRMGKQERKQARRLIQERIKRLATELFYTQLSQKPHFETRLEKLAKDVEKKKKSPYSAAKSLAR